LGQVVSQTELILHRGDWKRNGRVVVCASGAFDLLHPGHIRLLEQARSLGDIIVVAIESDAAVRARSVGIGAVTELLRPITPAAERAEILAALAAVDYVVEFDDPSPRDFLARFQPDIFVEGGSSGAGQSSEFDAAELHALGCKVVRIPLEPGYSTARLIQRIAEVRA